MAGISRSTAAATRWSSALIMRRACSVGSVSMDAEAGLGCSVSNFSSTFQASIKGGQTGDRGDRLKGMPLAIQADDVRAAAVRIRPLARQTPVFTCAGFDAEAGARVFFKCENLQRGGAFKIRGAANLVLSLSRESLARGVVAYSSGNHAQATAIAARYVGVASTIVMPEDAPQSKMEATPTY